MRSSGGTAHECPPSFESEIVASAWLTRLGTRQLAIEGETKAAGERCSLMSLALAKTTRQRSDGPVGAMLRPRSVTSGACAVESRVVELLGAVEKGALAVAVAVVDADGAVRAVRAVKGRVGALSAVAAINSGESEVRWGGRDGSKKVTIARQRPNALPSMAMQTRSLLLPPPPPRPPSPTPPPSPPPPPSSPPPPLPPPMAARASESEGNSHCARVTERNTAGTRA
eukprot:4181218-Pleurochrysis_carterae.AAC.1